MRTLRRLLHHGAEGQAMYGSMPSRRSIVDAVLIGALAGPLLFQIWMSREWPLIHDTPLLHYIAWLIGEGVVPYRDIFDMNLPGAYLLHMAIRGTLGGGSTGFRIFDLACLALIMSVLVVFTRRFGTAPAIISALLFALYHVSSGPWMAGQRDYALCALLVSAAALVAGAGEDDIGRLAAAGLVAGIGLTIKPTMAIFVLLTALAAIVGVGTFRLRSLRPGLIVLSGAAVAPLVCVFWLVGIGAWPAFVRQLTEYVLPLYSGLATMDPWTAVRRWAFGPQTWLLFLALCVQASLAGFPTVRARLAIAGAGFGAIHLLAQAKGFEYHTYPLAAFASVCAAIGLASQRRTVRTAAVSTLVLLILVLQLRGVRWGHSNWLTAKSARVAQMVRHLEGRLGDGETIQVLDTAEGGIHVLYALQARQPTRFIYDFHFYHDTDTAIIRSLRQELMTDLSSRPPQFVLLLRKGWPSGGYDRLSRFPELRQWLLERYALEKEANGYRIYARRAHSQDYSRLR